MTLHLILVGRPIKCTVTSGRSPFEGEGRGSRRDDSRDGKPCRIDSHPSGSIGSIAMHGCRGGGADRRTHQSGLTASMLISISMSGDARRVTWTMVPAGRGPPPKASFLQVL